MKSFKIDRTKILSVATASLLITTLLTGCGGKKQPVVSLTTQATTTEATTTTEEEETTTKKKVVKKATPTMNPKNIKLTAYRATVYAKNKMNVRSGPGTNYKIVKTIEKGAGIDVRYKTNNGWYKTINGNYVLASLTVKTKPA